MEKIEIGEVFTITDEDEKDHEVEVLATLTLDETNYMAVGFVEDIREMSEDDFDIFFLKLDEDGDLAAIESDEEFDRVSQALEDMMDEEDANENE